METCPLIFSSLNLHTELKFEKLYLEKLPKAELYERSYMHREVVTHVLVTKTDFIIRCAAVFSFLFMFANIFQLIPILLPALFVT